MKLYFYLMMFEVKYRIVSEDSAVWMGVVVVFVVVALYIIIEKLINEASRDLS